MQCTKIHEIALKSLLLLLLCVVRCDLWHAFWYWRYVFFSLLITNGNKPTLVNWFSCISWGFSICLVFFSCYHERISTEFRNRKSWPTKTTTKTIQCTIIINHSISIMHLEIFRRAFMKRNQAPDKCRKISRWN